MWFCTQCGIKNEDDSNFCYECGHSKEQDLENGSQSVVVEEEAKTAKKQNPKIFRIGIIAIVILALIGTAAFGAKDFLVRKLVLNDPVKRIAYGYMRLLDAKALDSTSRVSLEFTEYPDDPETKMIINLLNEFNILVSSKLDNKDNRFLQSMEFMLDDDVLLNASLYGDDESFALDLPMLLDGWAYIELKELESMLEDMDIIDGDTPEFTFEDYEKLFTLDDVKNWKEIRDDYMVLISEELSQYIKEEGKKVDVVINNGGKERIIKCEEIVIEMDFEDYFDFIEELFDEIEDDDRIRDLIAQKLQQFFDIAIENGDIDEMDLDEDDVEDIMDEFDDFYDEFFIGFNEGLDMAKEEMEYQESSIEYTCSFRFDSNNYLRGISYVGEVESTYYDHYEGYLDINFNIQTDFVVNSVNKGLDMEKPDLKDGYNISDDPEEAFYDMGMDIQENIEKLMESKEFEPIIELIQTIDPYFFY